MMYFLSDIVTYSPANKKCAELCDFLQEYKGTLIADRKTLVSFVSKVTNEIHRLNDLYRKSMPLIIHLSYEEKSLFVYSGYYDKTVCFICWQEVSQTLSLTTDTINQNNNNLKN